MITHLSPTVTIHTSAFWQTNTGIVRRGFEAVLIDPGVYPAELEAIAHELEGTRVVAGIVTHAHWDHMLWDARFGAAPRYASAITADMLRSRTDELAAQLDAAEADCEGRWDRKRIADARPIGFGLELVGDDRLELIDVSGHCAGQMAVRFPDENVCFVADTLSDIEAPSLDTHATAIEDYLASLDRLQHMIERTSHIVPGHGSPADQSEARRRLERDRRYLVYLPAAIQRASASMPDDELARRILSALDEPRARAGIAWEMHLDNVVQIRSRL